MENEEKVELTGNIFTEGYFCSVVFPNSRPYFFHTTLDNLKSGDNVVVETVRGLELGEIKQESKPISEMKEQLPLKDIIRVATEEDIHNAKENEKLALKAFYLCNEGIKLYNLDMKLLKTEYTLDATKAIFIYASESRVDFRDLLKFLASHLKCRIELRQIGARDRSKLIGGLGPCGLPLCCSQFIDNFDVISINMAKNQFLALNIQKLSGHCGKLICCLKYEDDQYSEYRKGLPKVNTRIEYDGQLFKITSINILTDQVRIENQEKILLVPLEEVLTIIGDKNGNNKS